MALRIDEFGVGLLGSDNSFMTRPSFFDSYDRIDALVEDGLANSNHVSIKSLVHELAPGLKQTTRGVSDLLVGHYCREHGQYEVLVFGQNNYISKK